MLRLRKIVGGILSAAIAFTPFVSEAHALPEAVVIGGVKYGLIEEFDRYGNLTKRILSGPQYSEFVLDLDQDGQYDHWEATENGTTVKVSGPVDGHLVRLEVEKRIKNGILKRTYFRQASTGQYRLTLSEVEPYRVYGAAAEDIQYLGWGNSNNVGQCNLKDAKALDVASEWQKLMERLSRGQEDRARRRLRCALDKFQYSLFDKSCFERADMKASLSDIKEGVIDVLLSNSGQRTGAGSKFLGCLAEAGLPQHAARIQDSFLSVNKDLLNALAAANANEDKPETTNKGLSRTSPCEPIDEPLDTARRTRFFTCEKKEQGDARVASYSSSKEQIGFALPSRETIAAMPKATSSTGKEAYASFFFHELLHHSEIADEETVTALQWCCTSGISDSNPSCQKAKDILDKTGKSTSYENLFASQFENYTTLRAQMNTMFESNFAEPLMKRYFTEFHDVNLKAQNDYNTCKAKKPEAECRQALNSTLAKFSEEYFNRPTTCKAFAEFNQSGKSVDCGKLAKEFASLFRSVSASEVQQLGQTGTRVNQGSFTSTDNVLQRAIVSPQNVENAAQAVANRNPPPNSLSGGGRFPADQNSTGNRGRRTAGSSRAPRRIESFRELRSRIAAETSQRRGLLREIASDTFETISRTVQPASAAERRRSGNRAGSASNSEVASNTSASGVPGFSATQFARRQLASLADYVSGGLRGSSARSGSTAGGTTEDPTVGAGAMLASVAAADPAKGNAPGRGAPETGAPQKEGDQSPRAGGGAGGNQGARAQAQAAAQRAKELRDAGLPEDLIEFISGPYSEVEKTLRDPKALNEFVDRLNDNDVRIWNKAGDVSYGQRDRWRFKYCPAADALRLEGRCGR